MNSTKVALIYLILGIPVEMKGYIGPLIDLVILLPANYLPGNLRGILYHLDKPLYFLFNPPLYIFSILKNTHFSFLSILFILSFVYSFLSALLISKFKSKDLNKN